MTIFVGDDWAEAHHDVHLMNEAGHKLAAKRLPEGLDGLAELLSMIAEHANDPCEVVIGIETERGMWVQTLVAGGFQVYAINPLSASRYRDRHNVAGAKSDPGDAKLLADLVRTDAHNHRQVAGDSGEANALKITARAHQNLIWDRTRQMNRLRSDLREFFPAALVAFDDLTHPDTLSVLLKASHPDAASSLTITQIRAAIKRGGRQRYLDSRAAEIQQALRGKHLTAAPQVAEAFAIAVRAAVHTIAEINTQIAVLEVELSRRFADHGDAEIYSSLPGLGSILGGRVLAEFGDDCKRYANAKARRNYAGTSPITVASGHRRSVSARHIRNDRLYDAVDKWAFSSLRNSEGCRSFYDQRRASGDLHHQALRALGNRLVGYLHGCLNSRTHYDEATACDHRRQLTPVEARD